MSEIEKTKKWICVACGFLLGFVEGSVLRMKRKDFYVEVEGGKVTVTCCRCGKKNELVDDKFSEIQDIKS